MKLMPLSLLLVTAVLTAGCNQPETSDSAQSDQTSTAATSGMDKNATADDKMAMPADDPANPYMQDEREMHDKMMAVKTGDASERWTRKMIEHHRGALAMSETALKGSKDEKIRQMAQKTIDMQTKDIADLNKMLTDNGKPAQ